MSEAAGLRGRKKAETRRAIAAAALELASRLGPDRITVDDIAAAAGVSARTVFNYFATKDDAILGIDPERRAEISRAVERRPADESPLRALRVVLGGMVTDPDAGRVWRARGALVRQHPGLQAARTASMASYERQLSEAVARRAGLDADTDLYPRLVVAAALSVLRVAIDHVPADATPEDLAATLDAAFVALERGLPALPPA